MKDLRIFKEGTTAVVFELPLRRDSESFPADKFQALFHVNRARGV